MTKFKALEQQVEVLVKFSEQIAAEISEWKSLVKSDQEDHVLERYQETEQALGTSVEMEQVLQGFVAKAKETDPDKAVYGERMVSRTLKLEETWRKVCEQLTKYESEMMPIVVPVREKRLEALRVENEQEHQRKVQEIARRQQEKELEMQRMAEENAKREQERAAEQAERNRKAEEEAEKAKAERIEYELRKALKEQFSAENLLKQAARSKRLAEASEMHMKELLALVENLHPSSIYRTMVKCLRGLVDNILQYPEDPRFRHIRRGNAQIQAELTDHEYGEETLACLGFEERMLQQPTKEEYFVLDEPDASTEMSAWVEWYDRLKDYQEVLHNSV